MTEPRSGAPVPTPLRRRWHLFRTARLPGLVFAGALASTIWLWSVNRPQPVPDAAAASAVQGVASSIEARQLRSRAEPQSQAIALASGGDALQLPGATNRVAGRSHLQ